MSSIGGSAPEQQLSSEQAIAEYNSIATRYHELYNQLPGLRQELARLTQIRNDKQSIKEQAKARLPANRSENKAFQNPVIATLEREYDDQISSISRNIDDINATLGPMNTRLQEIRIIYKKHIFSRISSSRPPQTAIGDFAGGPLPHTILSLMGYTFLSMFNTKMAMSLRATCHEFKDAVTRYPWEDLTTKVSNVELWRSCFPNARAANVRGNMLVDARFAPLAGVQKLNMSRSLGVTNAGFAQLGGYLSSLNISDCSNLTDAISGQLGRVHTLSIGSCLQLTDAFFTNLGQVSTLDMSRCHQITPNVLVHLPNIRRLNVRECPAFCTDESFLFLGNHGIEMIDVTHNNLDEVTVQGFRNLRGPELRQVTINMEGCMLTNVRKAREAGLIVKQQQPKLKFIALDVDQ